MQSPKAWKVIAQGRSCGQPTYSPSADEVTLVDECTPILLFYKECGMEALPIIFPLVIMKATQTYDGLIANEIREKLINHIWCRQCLHISKCQDCSYSLALQLPCALYVWCPLHGATDKPRCGEQPQSSIQKVFWYTKTIICCGQMPRSSSKILFKLDFFAWCPLLFSQVLKYKISR